MAGFTFHSKAAGPGVQSSVVSIDTSGNLIGTTTGGMSANGRFVTFENYVRDLCNGAPVGCVPATTAYATATSVPSFQPGTPSSTGRYIPYSRVLGCSIGYCANEIDFTDSCLGAPPGCTTSTQTLVPSSAGNASLNGMTPDGRYVSYTLANIGFAYDTCVSAAPGCAPKPYIVNVGPITSQSLSADGRFSVYATTPSQTDPIAHVSLHDSCLGAGIGCVPSDVMLSDPATTCAQPSISSDGQYSAYTCGNSVYLQKTCAGVSSGCNNDVTAVLIDQATVDPNNGGGSPNVSNGGRYVTFNATNDINALQTGYVFDSCIGVAAGCTQRTQPICVDANGAIANGNCRIDAISDDGTYIHFLTYASNLYQGADGGWHAYVAVNPLQ